METLLTNPWVHYLVLLVHVCAGIFWMGWIVFIFFLLSPVLKDTVPGRFRALFTRLKGRIRRVVFWLIVLIVLTGLHNVYYNGLFRPEILLGTGYGHRFLIKVGAALILFTIYGIAPYVTNNTDRENERSCGSTEPENESNNLVLILHVIAFTAGMTAALLGISLGG